MYQYKYDKEYQTLQQFDADGMLRSSMSMPQHDLKKIHRIPYMDCKNATLEQLRQEVLDNLNA